METEFMVYNLVFVMKMTVYTIWLVLLKGRVSAISFYGWEFEWTSWIWNTRFVMNHSWCLIRETRLHPSQLYMLISGFIIFTHRESYYSSRTYSQPGITALPRITADDCHNHNTEQPLLLSLKPRLMLYSNESCHTSRADTICAVSL